MTVVKLAQSGYDASTTGDENLVYSSSWPLLKIYKHGTVSFTGNVTDNNSAVTTHDLGYVPAFWIFSNSDIQEWLASGSRQAERRSEFNGPNGQSVGISADRLSAIPPLTLGTTTLKYEWYIFALDITKDYRAPKIKSGGVIGPRNLKTVFKLAKDNKDINSHRLEDYVVHSACRSPLVHAVVPFQLGFQQKFTYVHELGYKPMFFAYANGPGVNGTNYWMMLFTAGSVFGFSVDDQKIQFTAPFSSTNNYSLVVLKDPFNISNIIQVDI